MSQGRGRSPCDTTSSGVALQRYRPHTRTYDHIMSTSYQYWVWRQIVHKNPAAVSAARYMENTRAVLIATAVMREGVHLHLERLLPFTTASCAPPRTLLVHSCVSVCTTCTRIRRYFTATSNRITCSSWTARKSFSWGTSASPRSSTTTTSKSRQRWAPDLAHSPTGPSAACWCAPSSH